MPSVSRAIPCKDTQVNPVPFCTFEILNTALATMSISNCTNDTPFVRLPAELDNQIYKLVLHTDQPLIISKPPQKCLDARTSLDELKGPLALNGNCRQIYQETTKMFYAINIVAVHSQRSNAARTLEAFIHTIGEKKAQALRSIEVSFPNDPVELAVGNENQLQSFYQSLEELLCVTKQIPNCAIQALIEFRLPNDQARERRSLWLDLRDFSKTWRAADDHLEDMLWTEPLSANCCLLEKFRKQLDGCRQDLQCV